MTLAGKHLAIATVACALIASLAVPSRPAMAAATRGSTITLPNGSRFSLQTPSDLQVTVYATGLNNPRLLALGPKGDIFVGTRFAGTVSVLLNRKGGPHATQVSTLLSGLTVPDSVAYRNGRLYVAEEGQVSEWSYNQSAVSVSGQRIVVSSLPTGGLHTTRTLAFGLNGSLYVSVGSSCNECADYSGRGVIMRYKPDGSGGVVYASGLRNAVGIAIQPKTGNLWADDNGQDLLGDNIPPDEIDLIKQGKNYGWPYCWGNQKADPTLGSAAGYCASTVSPVVSLQAHSAPIGVAFGTGTLLPARYRGGLFVAYHGSAYRSQATGYKVVYIPINGTHAGVPQDVVTGWLSASGVWGRPAGVVIAADGSLLISDDQAGVIYRVAPVGR
ncbi:MAG TPA: PQQ-dependent sugar dehydrogenase [Chloroflexota bacterium]|nr:PQQ-dependent sugar dehydrogenase [Chloroflexota bacterium]